MKPGSALGWIGSFAVLAALYMGLDPYRRLPLDYGYGPERRAFFDETLRQARRLQEKGEVSIAVPDRWHLLGSWSDPEEEDPPRTSQRRARVVLPVLRPAAIEIEIDALSLIGPVEVELGVNGAAVARASIPEGGGRLRFQAAESQLYRGDNTIYVYRSSRSATPDPWIAVRAVTFRSSHTVTIGPPRDTAPKPASGR